MDRLHYGLVAVVALFAVGLIGVAWGPLQPSGEAQTVTSIATTTSTLTQSTIKTTTQTQAQTIHTTTTVTSERPVTTTATSTVTSTRTTTSVTTSTTTRSTTSTLTSTLTTTAVTTSTTTTTLSTATTTVTTTKSTTLTTTTTSTAKKSDLIIRGVTDSVNQYGWYIVRGEVLNNGSVLAELVTIYSTFYDADQNVIETSVDFTSPSDIDAGDAASFEIVIFDEEIISQIASYKLVADV